MVMRLCFCFGGKGEKEVFVGGKIYYASFGKEGVSCRAFNIGFVSFKQLFRCTCLGVKGE